MAAEFKKQFSQNFSTLELPPPLNHVTPEALAAAIRPGDHAPDVTRVIDVRPADEFAKGHIRGSDNIPLDNLLDAESPAMQGLVSDVKKVLAQGKAVSMIFVSLQSPGIDEAGALAFVKAWDEQGTKPSDDPSPHPPGASFTHILLGGIYYFLQLHRHDALIDSYDATTWDPLLVVDGAAEE